MQSNLKLASILLLLLWMLPDAEAQRDTVFVYEDVIVYDTLVVYDTVFVQAEINNLLLDKVKFVSILNIDTTTGLANLMLISEDRSATIPINSIIVNENIKNLEIMRKLGFFAVFGFAFQTMVMAQTSYEVSLGSGIWYENYKHESYRKPIAPMLSGGMYAKRNFDNSHFGLRAGLEYAYLFGISDSQEYYAQGSISVGEALNNNYRAGMHNISLPLLVYYDKFFIRPYVGINYNYLRTGKYSHYVPSTGYNNNGSGNGSWSGNNNSHNFGVMGGFDLKLSKGIAVRIESRFNVTSDYRVDGQALGNNTHGQVVSTHRNSYGLRNSQAKISLVYSFGNKKKATKQEDYASSK
ncbi:MAG: hypothetical protein ACK5L5_00160 [Bacteroidales bacterium]